MTTSIAKDLAIMPRGLHDFCETFGDSIIAGIREDIVYYADGRRFGEAWMTKGGTFRGAACWLEPLPGTPAGTAWSQWNQRKPI